MSSERLLSNRLFTRYNSITLAGLFCYVWIRDLWLNGSSPQNILFWPGAYFLSLWSLSPLILLYFSSTSFRKMRSMAKNHLMAALLFGLLHWIATGLLIILLERLFRLPEHFHIADPAAYISSSWPFAVDGFLWYGGYLLVFILLQTRQRLETEKTKQEQLQKELAASDLSFLKTELNPHFLFNAMNSIAMKVRLKENKVAVSMIASLNDLLRSVLSGKKDKTIPLSEEVELLEKYLMIEKIRFGDQVNVLKEFPAETLNSRVPQMILQPLVENAFKHGIKDNLSQQQINIKAAKENGTVVLTIFNTTEKLPRFDHFNGTEGIGLPNIIHRLRRHYGANFQFQSMVVESGVAFRITLPLQLQ